MKFTELSLENAFIIQPDLIEDERGFFARSFCIDEFKKNGLNPNLEQCNISFNHKKGTLRGMHYQIGDKSEVKVVRCTMGKIYDVIIDLRPKSMTYKKWQGFELSAENRQMLYIPEGFAHGFQTLEDKTEVFYQMSASFAPSFARGIRWNDSSFKIDWPITTPSIISLKDQQYPDYIS
jgi:dTDP-4-dehydrorhamnose 3,5-epimerase